MDDWSVAFVVAGITLYAVACFFILLLFDYLDRRDQRKNGNRRLK